MRPRPPRLRPALASVAVMTAAAACGGDDDAVAERVPVSTVADPETASNAEPATGADRFPDVLDVEPRFDEATGTWSFSVTMSSPYDTPERYADGWRVVGPDGTVFGVHTLTHDHANEQPFTRTQTGVEIPADVDEVTIVGRDRANGFGGDTVTVPLRPG